MTARVKKQNSAESYAEFLRVAGAAPYNNDYDLVLRTLRRGERGTGDRVRPSTATEVVSLKVNGIINQTEARRYLGLGRSRAAKNAPKRNS